MIGPFLVFFDEVVDVGAVLLVFGGDVGYFVLFGEGEEFYLMLDLKVTFEVVTRPAYALEHVLKFQVVADSEVLGYCLDAGRPA